MNKFEFVYEYTIEDSIYDDELFYNDDWYKLCYEGEELYVYDEEDYPMSLSLEVRNIQKRATLYVPYTKDNYRNVKLFRQGIDYAINLIYRMFANEEEYDIEVYYESE